MTKICIMGEKEVEIIVALGSNDCPVENMQKAMEVLKHTFDGIVFTRGLWTEPIGVKSGLFLNVLCCAHTSFSRHEVLEVLEQVEVLCVRKRSGCRVSMDADLLLYGKKCFHVDDWSRDYVVLLLKELGKL